MVKADAFVPLESEEQAEFVLWLEQQALRFSALPMSTWTSSFRQKRHNHSQGVRAGVPDLIVLIPPKRAKDDKGHLVFVEMKRVKGGTVSAEQKEWIAELNALEPTAIHAEVCKGAHAAKEYISGYLNNAQIHLF